MERNHYGFADEDFNEFKVNHMKIKKEIELGVIQSNKKIEVQNKILKLLAPRNGREQEREKAKHTLKTAYRVIKNIKRKEHADAREMQRLMKLQQEEI